MVFLVDDMGVMDTSVPFLTDSTGRPIRYPLNGMSGTEPQAWKGLQQAGYVSTNSMQ